MSTCLHILFLFLSIICLIGPIPFPSARFIHRLHTVCNRASLEMLDIRCDSTTSDGIGSPNPDANLLIGNFHVREKIILPRLSKDVSPNTLYKSKQYSARGDPNIGRDIIDEIENIARSNSSSFDINHPDYSDINRRLERKKKKCPTKVDWHRRVRQGDTYKKIYDLCSVKLSCLELQNPVVFPAVGGVVRVPGNPLCPEKKKWN